MSSTLSKLESIDRLRFSELDKAFVPLLPKVIIETRGETLPSVIQYGTVSTNVYARNEQFTLPPLEDYERNIASDSMTPLALGYSSDPFITTMTN
jgi:hypothetical protein